MKVLLDTDIVLDLLLARASFVDEAEALFDAHDQGEIQAFISAITPANVFYIAGKVLGRPGVLQAIYELLASVDVCAVNQQVLQAALNLPFSDFGEDATQTASAINAKLDAIVTRNQSDYKNSPLPVYSPSDLLTLLAAAKQQGTGQRLN